MRGIGRRNPIVRTHIVGVLLLLWSAASRTTEGAASDTGCLSAGCHQPLTEQRFVHAPVKQGDCAVCHAPAGRPPDGEDAHPVTTLVPPNLELCSKCHTGHSAQHASLHAPYLDDCTKCHNPHGGMHARFLPTRETGDLCLQCHEGVRTGAAFVHGPVALKNCTACHDAHASEARPLLTRSGPASCLGCHQTLAKERAESAVQHPPAVENCLACHNPHKGERRAFLAAEPADVCAACHDSIRHRSESAAYPHKEMIAGRSCAGCHEPHWSADAGLLKKASIEICLGCHDRDVTAADGRLLPSVRDQIEQGRFRHGPIRQGDCTPCHSAHGSEDPRLMKAAFPAQFYAEYGEDAYALCFKCHDANIVRKERTLATGFRNGDVNLHAVHVRQKDKGRSCRACHHEHASSQPFHIRDSVTFGNWSLPIRFEGNPTGGTCLAACHKPRGYDRENPVANDVAGAGAAAPAMAKGGT